MVGEADRHHEEEGGEAADLLLSPAVAEVSVAQALLTFLHTKVYSGRKARVGSITLFCILYTILYIKFTLGLNHKHCSSSCTVHTFR